MCVQLRGDCGYFGSKRSASVALLRYIRLPGPLKTRMTSYKHEISRHTSYVCLDIFYFYDLLLRWSISGVEAFQSMNNIGCE